MYVCRLSTRTPSLECVLCPFDAKSRSMSSSALSFTFLAIFAHVPRQACAGVYLGIRVLGLPHTCGFSLCSRRCWCPLIDDLAICAGQTLKVGRPCGGKIVRTCLWRDGRFSSMVWEGPSRFCTQVWGCLLARRGRMLRYSVVGAAHTPAEVWFCLRHLDVRRCRPWLRAREYEEGYRMCSFWHGGWSLTLL